MKAIWHGVVVAESDDTVILGGEHYFPASALRQEYLLPSDERSMSLDKGEARYLTLFVEGDAKPNAVWYFPEPKEAAREIKGRMAFCRSVAIEP